MLFPAFDEFDVNVEEGIMLAHLSNSSIDPGRPMSSKHVRTLAAVFEEPTRANILWRDVVSMLAHYGAELEEAAGSRVTVDLNGGSTVIHRPHPAKELRRYAVENLREFLLSVGVTP